HMVHMPGHIWLILGDWEMAASVNERAVQVDQNYFSATHVMGGSYMPYYIHNLHFVLYARSMQGRKRDALEAASRLLSEMEPVVDAMPEWADSFLPVPMLAYVRFGDWDSLLKMPQPKPGMKTSTTVWHFGRAMALSAKGDKPGAARERDAFEKMRAQVAVEAPWGQNKASVLLHLASEVISARLADSPAEAIPHWQRAVQMQDTLVYDEPPAWYYPLRESLGAEQLRAGRPADAEQTFREGVKRSPRNGRMLFGLLQSLQAQRKQEDAAWVKREFEANWAKADISLSLAAL
ncbi:MAG TPA: hypothetical protein VG672_06870, partial [Bryobacteraceae bacterium]|nr:hypothetical protein [Bryobacteraceae bacterium]